MYAKLFSRIAQSSLMEQDVSTRYVFMMLLAIADAKGDVIGTDTAIARMLNIPKADFIKAVKKLKEPDEDSNSEAEDGRRIVDSDVGRGYCLVNYCSYRAIKTDDEKREYMREYMRKRRQTGKDVKLTVNPVNFCKTQLSDVTQAEAEAEAEANKDTCPKSDDSAFLLTIWESLPSKAKERSSKKKFKDAWIKAKKKTTKEIVTASIKKWITSKAWTEDGGQFAPGVHVWLNDEKWEVEPEQAEIVRKEGETRTTAEGKTERWDSYKKRWQRVLC